MTLQGLQDALLNLYVNPAYREADLAYVLERHEMDRAERATLEGVLADSAALRRFRAALRQKKWLFLWGQTCAAVGIDLSTFESAMYARFTAEWAFRDLPLGVELQEFIDLLHEVSAPSTSPALTRALALGGLRVDVLFASGPWGEGLLTYSEAVPAHPERHLLRFAPWAAARIVTEDDGAEGYYLAAPSRTSFTADVVRVSEALHGVVTSATAFDSFQRLRAALATATGTDPTAAADALGELIGRGMFEFTPAPVAS